MKPLLFCAGAWTGKIVTQLGAPLVVTRQVMGWVRGEKMNRFELARFPVWGVEEEVGALAYGFPIAGDVAAGMKVALHKKGTPTDADHVSREISQTDRDDVLGVARRNFGGDSWELIAAKVCLYTNSPDGHFIADRVPGTETAWFAGGFSGHGFKFASVMGEVLAEWVISGACKREAEFLGLARFGGKVR